MHKLILPLLFLFLISCTSEQKTNDEDKQVVKIEEEANSPDIESLKIDSFKVSEFPEAIDGCACYFGSGENEYLYVDDYAQTAFLKVNGSFEQLELYDISHGDEEVSQKGRSEHYNLELNLKKVSSVDETIQYEGTLKVMDITGSQVEVKVKGECGC